MIAGALRYKRKNIFWLLFSFLSLSSIFCGSLIASNTPELMPEESARVDVIIFSDDRPLQLYTLLESMVRYVIGVGTMHVIYRTSGKEYSAAYQEVARSFPQAHFINQDSSAQRNFKPLLLEALEKSEHKYLFFAYDDNVFKDYVDVRNCASALDQKKSCAFYLALGKNIKRSLTTMTPHPLPTLIQIDADIYLWDFKATNGDWHNPPLFETTIYNRADISNSCSVLDYHDPLSLAQSFAQNNMLAQGLCFSQSKAINLVLSRINGNDKKPVQKIMRSNLLTNYNQRLKINLEKIYELNNDAYVYFYDPQFTQRQPAEALVKPAHTEKNNIRQQQFIIITPSFNNARWYKRNVDSLLYQDYSNYHVIYIDDASPDQTGAFVERHVLRTNKKDKITIIKNKERVGALENIYNAIQSCPDDAIILLVDGDDWLYNGQVLTKLNMLYQDQKVWMTYGQFTNYPYAEISDYHALPEEVINNHTYRTHAWTTSHLRTFRTWLFKKIVRDDLLYLDNKFFQVTWDQAFMFPLLEMSGNHSRFIEEVLYVYNMANPLNDNKVHMMLQRSCEAMIRNKPAYQRLSDDLSEDMSQKGS